MMSRESLIKRRPKKQQQGNVVHENFFLLFSLLNLHTHSNGGCVNQNHVELRVHSFGNNVQFLHEYSIHNFFKRGILRPVYCKINKIDPISFLWENWKYSLRSCGCSLYLTVSLSIYQVFYTIFELKTSYVVLLWIMEFPITRCSNFSIYQ